MDSLLELPGARLRSGRAQRPRGRRESHGPASYTRRILVTNPARTNHNVRSAPGDAARDVWTREVRAQYARFDRRAKAWLDDYTRAGGRVYCASGCFRCCDMPIRLSWAEALTLSESLTPEQHRAVREHARKVWRNAHASRTPDEYVERHRREVGFCPLLDRETGSCTQYADRPTRCRDTYSALPAFLCAPDGPAQLSRSERRRYEQVVRTDPVMDGETHFIAPLEQLSEPAWVAFSKLMRKGLGFELWGDFHYLVAMTMEPDFHAALALRDRKKVIAALRKAGLYHPEIVQVE